MKPHKGALPKLTPLYQSSPLVERPRADESDENFLIVPHNESEIPGSAGDVTLTVQALQKQVNKALKIVLKPTVQQILYFFRNTKSCASKIRFRFAKKVAFCRKNVKSDKKFEISVSV